MIILKLLLKGSFELPSCILCAVSNFQRYCRLQGDLWEFELLGNKTISCHRLKNTQILAMMSKLNLGSKTLQTT